MDPRVAPPPPAEPLDFIRAMVRDDLAAGRVKKVVTRFPPEPNGFLHIGHAKSICLNFGLAAEHAGGICNLRFDDTNPETEDPKYVAGIQEDVRWLGFDWADRLYFASDYFERNYQDAIRLIRMKKAFVCDLSEEQFKEYRGTISAPGKSSPFKARSVAENLDLFARMRAGEFAEGSRVLRADIDMASPNMKMRDPPIYRIKKAPHYRTGTAWPIYPMYDYAHPLSDAYEGITHSLCSLEFENNRELYDWYLNTLGYGNPPHQTEFARLSLTYMVMNKRKLRRLVEGGQVRGWDDPRMPTLSGLRRRGVTPEAIRAFCDAIGVAKANSLVDLGMLEHAIRDDLNTKAPRVMAVLRPLKVTIENWPAGELETLDAPSWPHDVGKPGSRPVPFGRTLFIEEDDFAEVPPAGWHRLSPGAEVRLRYAYVIRCERVLKDPCGRPVELVCTYDPATRSGSGDGKKVKGTIHWVEASTAQDAEVRLYDRLFRVPEPEADGVDFMEKLNPESLVTLTGCKLEPSLAAVPAGARFQFERQGYFVADSGDHRADRRVFGRTIPLKDSWAKLAEKDEPAPPPRARAAKAEPAKTAARDHGAELSGPARARFDELTTQRGVGDEAARVLSEDGPAKTMFDAALAAGAQAPGAANLVVNEVVRVLKEAGRTDAPFDGTAIAELAGLVESAGLTGPNTRLVLAAMLAGEGRPGAIVAAKGLAALTDEAALGPLVDEVLAANPGQLAQYRGGKTGLRGFFVGQVMKKSGGRADPKVLGALLDRKLAG